MKPGSSCSCWANRVFKVRVQAVINPVAIR